MLVLVALVWTAIALPVGVLVGKGIRLADRAQRKSSVGVAPR